MVMVGTATLGYFCAELSCSLVTSFPSCSGFLMAATDNAKKNSSIWNFSIFWNLAGDAAFPSHSFTDHDNDFQQVGLQNSTS